MSSIKDFNNIKYELINPNGVGDKVVKATFDYKGEHFSYNVIVPNNPKIKKEKYYIKEAKKTFITLANNGELAKSADARIHAKRVKNFSDFDYEVINSSVVGYAEVRATLKYQDKVVTRYLFIKEVAGKKDDYYIDQAKAEIRKEIINDELSKESKKYLKPKKVSTAGKVAIAVLAVAAVGCGAFLTYKYLYPNYTVSFDTNGGTSIEAQSVRRGKLAKEPEDPLKHGYDFEGWCSDEDCKVPFDFTKDAINKNIVLYADWAPIECTITIDPNNEGEQPPYEVIGTFGEPLEKQTDPTYEHYVFAGWYKTPKDGIEEDEPYNFNTPVDGDFTLKAHWTKEVYTVSFDLDGGTGYGDYSMQYVKYDEHAHDPIIDVEFDKPTKIGHTFDYWYDSTLEEPEAFDFGTGIDRNYVLKAHYTVNEYTITFDTDGGSEAPEAQKVNYGETVAPVDDPTKEHYEFLGWYKTPYGGEEEDEPYNFNTPVDGDFTLTAHWTEEIYTVSFDLAGGTGTGNYKPQPVAYNGYATNPSATKETEPTKTGHTFSGWFAPNEETKFVFDSTPITADLVLTAHYTVNQYTITFDTDGGSEAPEEQEVNYGGTVTPVAVPTKEGNTFIGWYKTPAGGTEEAQAYDFDRPVDGNFTLTAHWDINTFTVTIDPNGSKFTDGTTITKIISANYGTTWAQFKTAHGEEIKIDEASFPEGMGSYIYQYYDATSGWTDLTDDATIQIKANFSVKVKFIPVDPSDFANDSWETFNKYVTESTWAQLTASTSHYYDSYISAEGKQANTFVGLTRTIKMNDSDTTYQVRVIGENIGAGVDQAKFTFEFINTLELEVPYNLDDMGDAKYVDSYINKHLNNNFFYMLPEAVRSSIKQSTITCFGETDPLSVNMFVLSASELGFTQFPDGTVVPSEGSAYTYYLTGSKIKNVNGGSSPVNYWIRTPDTHGAYGAAWNVNTTGGLGIGGQSIATDSDNVYIAPAFRV